MDLGVNLVGNNLIRINGKSLVQLQNKLTITIIRKHDEYNYWGKTSQRARENDLWCDLRFVDRGKHKSNKNQHHHEYRSNKKMAERLKNNVHQYQYQTHCRWKTSNDRIEIQCMGLSPSSILGLSTTSTSSIPSTSSTAPQITVGTTCQLKCRYNIESVLSLISWIHHPWIETWNISLN